MKTISHVQKMRETAQSNKKAVQKLIGWDDLQYCEFQEQCGRQYLIDVLCPDGYGLAELGSSRIFWRWWINQWNKRDDDFLNSDVFAFERSVYGDDHAYVMINSPEYLRYWYPHRVVLENTYGEMIGQLLDNK